MHNKKIKVDSREKKLYCDYKNGILKDTKLLVY